MKTDFLGTHVLQGNFLRKGQESYNNYRKCLPKTKQYLWTIALSMCLQNQHFQLWWNFTILLIFQNEKNGQLGEESNSVVNVSEFEVQPLLLVNYFWLLTTMTHTFSLTIVMCICFGLHYSQHHFSCLCYDVETTESDKKMWIFLC